MHARPDRSQSFDSPPEATLRRYCVLLRVDEGWRAEHLIRRLIEHKRGDLLAMERRGLQRHARLRLHLGDRRIHDVITSLEAAGFAVNAVIAT